MSIETPYRGLDLSKQQMARALRNAQVVQLRPHGHGKVAVFVGNARHVAASLFDAAKYATTRIVRRMRGLCPACGSRTRTPVGGYRRCDQCNRWVSQ